MPKKLNHHGLALPQLYCLADTLGLCLEMTRRGKVRGQEDFGVQFHGLELFTLSFKFAVVASFHDGRGFKIGLLCEAVGDLGLFIFHDAEEQAVYLDILDRSKIVPSWEVVCANLENVKTLAGARRKLKDGVTQRFKKGQKEDAWVAES